MNKFRRVYLEIINYCNLACSFCPRSKRKPMAMSIDNFNIALDKLKPYTDYLYFHIKGEPFLHPNLVDFLKIASEKGFYVNITTNGTLVNNLRKPLLENVPVRQINISLHSFEGDKKEEFKKYLMDIIRFTKEVTKAQPIYIALRLWNLDKDITTEQRERNIEVLELIEKEFQLDYKIETKIDEEKGSKIADHVYLNYDYKFSWPSLDADYIGDSGYCYGLKTQLGILVDGTVVPCCLDGEGIVDLGNIFDQDLEEIFESTYVKDIQEGFRQRKVKEELCQRCGYRTRFN